MSSTDIQAVQIFGPDGAITDFGGAGGVSQDDNSAFTVNTSEVVPIGGLYEAAPTSLTSGRVGAIGVTQTRAVRAAVESLPAIPAGTNNIGDVDVLSLNDVAASFDTGANRDIDATAEQITSSSVVATKGVLLRADPANTGIVYIGNSDVTAGTDGTTDGMPLEAGDSLLVKVNNVNLLYAIGSAANQIVYWMAV